MNNICYGVDMSKEVWKPVNIEGYRYTHEASNFGRVRTVDRIVKGRNGSTRTIKGVILAVNSNNTIQLQANKHKLMIRPIDIIGYTFIPNYHKYMNVTYIDGNVNNVKLDNILTIQGMGNNITLMCKTQIIDDIQVIEGGFAEGGRVLFDITIANKIGKSVGELRIQNIIPNLNNWIKGTDYIDLKEYNNFTSFVPMLLDLGYTETSLVQSEHIFIFSERGIAKVMSSLHNSNPVKWEFLNNFVNEYFTMREQINEGYRPSNYLEALKQLVIEVEAKEKAQKEAEEAKLLADSLKDENIVIKEKLDKMGIKPPYTVSSIQSATKATRTAVVQYMLDNNWVIRKIKEGKPRGFIVVNEDYVAQANGDKVWGIHLTAKGTWHLLEVFNHKQNKLF